MAPAPDPFIGRTIINGEFRVDQKIGTGGMGSVYRAQQTAMNRMVAIKILHPRLANRKDLSSRFRREARAMSQLNHPNTAKVFTFGELPDDGSLYIVMELLEGQNLNQVVRKGGPLAQERAIPILVQVCGALQEAHDLGIVHRDLKPENIFLCNQGPLKDYPKVLDFGLAKVTEQQMRPGSLILTQEGMVFGTPEFMSPEQAQGQQLDARSDIYSLSVILYEVLTGKLPFSAKSPMEYIQQHVMGQPIPLSRRVEGKVFAHGLDEVIARALNKKPELRYQSAAEFGEALKPYADPLYGLDELTPTPLAAMPVGPGSPYSLQNPAGPPVPGRLGPPPQWVGAQSGAMVSSPTAVTPLAPPPPAMGTGPLPVPVPPQIPQAYQLGGVGLVVLAAVAVFCLLAGVVLAVLVMRALQLG